jgi:hypothetical protein
MAQQIIGHERRTFSHSSADRTIAREIIEGSDVRSRRISSAEGSGLNVRTRRIPSQALLFIVGRSSGLHSRKRRRRRKRKGEDYRGGSLRGGAVLLL